MVSVQRIIMPEGEKWNGEGHILIDFPGGVPDFLAMGLGRIILDRDTARQLSDKLAELLDEWSLEDQEKS